MSLSITGRAPTTRADRYAKQLSSHLSGSLPVTVVGATSSIEFKGVRGSVTVTETGLEIAISAPDAELLFRGMDVVERHLVRFGERDGLTVRWDDPDLAQQYRDALSDDAG